MLKHAQGTIEYLVIISIVVVLALAVVGLLVNQADSVSEVSVSSNELGSKVGFGGLSISSSVVDIDGNGLIVIKNNSGENLSLNKIVVDGVDHSFSEQLVSGDEKSFKLRGVAACELSAKSKEYSVKIEYTSQEGLSKVSDFQTLTIDCVNVTTALKIPAEETNSTVFYNGTALSFDGSDDYVDLSTSAFVQSTTTISFWVYLNRNTGEPIFIKQSDGENTYNFIAIGMYTSSIGYQVVGTPGKIYYHPRNAYTIFSSNTNMSTGQWYHVVLVISSSSVSCYINGVLDKTSSGTFTWSTDTTVTNQRIGGWSNGPLSLNGLLDELTIWNRTLSSDEISQLYNSGNGLYADTSIAPFDSGLVAAYHFDEGSGTTLIDVTGGNNGVLANGPAYVTGKVGHYN